MTENTKTEEMTDFEHNFDVFRENQMNCNFSEENLKNDYLFNNSSAVYESLEDNKENEELMNKSTDNMKTNEFCVHNCHQIINKLISDNEELKKCKQQVIVFEEQNVELIRDNECLKAVVNQMKESFERKVSLKNDIIEDLKKSLYIFESLNSSLHKELDHKRNEMIRFEDNVKELEDKLYYSEIQLIECQKSEEELMSSYNNVRQQFTEEEDNKYKAVEHLHSIYVECAQQQNEIKELKEQVCDLNREIADRDNELWFYKIKFDESLHTCGHKVDRYSTDTQRESIVVNKTTSGIPEYSFSVNEDDFDHIYSDFNEDNNEDIDNQSEQSSEFHSISEQEMSEDFEPIVDREVISQNNLFNRFFNCFSFFVFRIPFKIILATILIIISMKLFMTSILLTRLPAYTSWEEIIYRLLLPYLTKVKVSKTQ